MSTRYSSMPQPRETNAELPTYVCKPFMALTPAVESDTAAKV